VDPGNVPGNARGLHHQTDFSVEFSPDGSTFSGIGGDDKDDFALVNGRYSGILT
jgi:hypothetical protein